MFMLQVFWHRISVHRQLEINIQGLPVVAVDCKISMYTVPVSLLAWPCNVNNAQVHSFARPKKLTKKSTPQKDFLAVQCVVLR